MPRTVAQINTNKLAQAIAGEIDEMNNSGFGSSTTWAIGEYLGMQVQIRITRDEDEIDGDVSEANRCIAFARKK